MSKLQLVGCRAEPLASYLKALGVLRVVGQQHDTSARGYWRGDGFVIDGDTDAESLVEFLVDRYEPTPLVSPWNAGGGFRTDVEGSAEKVVASIEATDEDRLARYREAIALARRIHREAEVLGFASVGKPIERMKAEFIELCRNRLPDSVLSWLDTAVVLTDDGASYPTIVGGSGGNLGRGDLSHNFRARLLDVFALRGGRGAPNRDHSVAWTRAALFGEGGPDLTKNMIGQFDPGGSGGVNSPGGTSLVNPWDFILAMEGLLFFGAATARRFGSSVASVPFEVRASPVGYGSASTGESVRGELWLPIWDRPIGLAELERLFAEGRSQWGREQAGTGLDFARAVATLGVDRSITHFTRFTIAQRHGQSNLAIPVDRVQVTERPGVGVLRQLDTWVDRLSFGNVSHAVSSAIRRLEGAEYLAATKGARADRMQVVVIALGELDHAVAVSPKARDRVGPMSQLDAERWLPVLDDRSPEFRVAVALASQHDTLPRRGELSPGAEQGGRLATLLRPVILHKGTTRLAWSERSPIVPGLGRQSLPAVLASALAARFRLAVDTMADNAGAEDPHGLAPPGIAPAFDWSIPAGLDHVTLFGAGELDEGRISRLLAGLLLLDWRGAKKLSNQRPSDVPRDPLWCLLAPFVHQVARRTSKSVGGALLSDLGDLRMLRARAGWGEQLAAGRAEEVARGAITRLRMAGFVPLVDAAVISRVGDAQRVAATLFVPINLRDLVALTRQVCAQRNLDGPSDLERKAS